MKRIKGGPSWQRRSGTLIPLSVARGREGSRGRVGAVFIKSSWGEKQKKEQREGLACFSLFCQREESRGVVVQLTEGGVRGVRNDKKPSRTGSRIEIELREKKSLIGQRSVTRSFCGKTNGEKENSSGHPA